MSTVEKLLYPTEQKHKCPQNWFRAGSAVTRNSFNTDKTGFNQSLKQELEKLFKLTQNLAEALNTGEVKAEAFQATLLTPVTNWTVGKQTAKGFHHYFEDFQAVRTHLKSRYESTAEKVKVLAANITGFQGSQYQLSSELQAPDLVKVDTENALPACCKKNLTDQTKLAEYVGLYFAAEKSFDHLDEWVELAENTMKESRQALVEIAETMPSQVENTERHLQQSEDLVAKLKSELEVEKVKSARLNKELLETKVRLAQAEAKQKELENLQQEHEQLKAMFQAFLGFHGNATSNS